MPPNELDYVITFVDGSVEHARGVTRGELSGGVLSLYRRQTSYGPAEDHIASYPVAGIRKWETERPHAR